MTTTVTTSVTKNTQSFSRTGTTGVITPTNVTKVSNNQFVLDIGLSSKMRGIEVTFKSVGLKPNEFHYAFFDNIPVSHFCSGPDYIWLDEDVNSSTKGADFLYNKTYEKAKDTANASCTVLHRYGKMLFVQDVIGTFGVGNIIVGQTSNATAKIVDYVKMNGVCGVTTENTVVLAPGSFDYGFDDSGEVDITTTHETFGNYSNMFNSGKGAVITIVAGPGLGQQRIITGYNKITRVATVDAAWQVSPTGATYSLNTISSTPDGVVAGKFHVPVNTFTTGEKKFRISSSPTNSHTSESYSETTFTSQGLLQNKAALSVSTKGFSYSTQSATESFPTLTYVSEVNQTKGAGPSPGPLPVIPTFVTSPMPSAINPQTMTVYTPTELTVVDTIKPTVVVIPETPSTTDSSSDQVFADQTLININVTSTASLISYNSKNYIYPISSITSTATGSWKWKMTVNKEHAQAKTMEPGTRKFNTARTGVTHGIMPVTNLVLPKGSKIGVNGAPFNGDTEASRTIQVIDLDALSGKSLLTWDECTIGPIDSSTGQHVLGSSVIGSTTAKKPTLDVYQTLIKAYPIYDPTVQSGTKTYTVNGLTGLGNWETPNPGGITYKNGVTVKINYANLTPTITPVISSTPTSGLGRWFTATVSLPAYGHKVAAGYGAMVWKGLTAAITATTSVYIPAIGEVINDNSLNFKAHTSTGEPEETNNTINKINWWSGVKLRFSEATRSNMTGATSEENAAAESIFQGLSDTMYMRISDNPQGTCVGAMVSQLTDRESQLKYIAGGLMGVFVGDSLANSYFNTAPTITLTNNNIKLKLNVKKLNSNSDSCVRFHNVFGGDGGGWTDINVTGWDTVNWWSSWYKTPKTVEKGFMFKSKTIPYSDELGITTQNLRLIKMFCTQFSLSLWTPTNGVYLYNNTYKASKFKNFIIDTSYSSGNENSFHYYTFNDLYTTYNEQDDFNYVLKYGKNNIPWNDRDFHSYAAGDIFTGANFS